jgi:hypothetical protein
MLPAERAYIESLRLGPPQLSDSFSVFKDGELPDSTFCILFPQVLLLCRLQPVHISFASTYMFQQTQVALVYGYIYPRHIYSTQLNETMNGTRVVRPDLGFLLVCEGTWGDTKHYLSLNLQPTRAVPNLPQIWTQAIQTFRKTSLPQIGTYLDRLPLGPVFLFLKWLMMRNSLLKLISKYSMGPTRKFSERCFVPL